MRVQEILALQGRPAIAVDAGGALYLVPSDCPPFSLPGGVTGEVLVGGGPRCSCGTSRMSPNWTLAPRLGPIRRVLLQQ